MTWWQLHKLFKKFRYWGRWEFLRKVNLTLSRNLLATLDFSPVSSSAQHDEWRKEKSSNLITFNSYDQTTLYNHQSSIAKLARIEIRESATHRLQNSRSVRCKTTLTDSLFSESTADSNFAEKKRECCSERVPCLHETQLAPGSLTRFWLLKFDILIGYIWLRQNFLEVSSLHSVVLGVYIIGRRHHQFACGYIHAHISFYGIAITSIKHSYTSTIHYWPRMANCLTACLEFTFSDNLSLLKYFQSRENRSKTFVYMFNKLSTCGGTPRILS